MQDDHGQKCAESKEMPYEEWFASRSIGELVDHAAEFAEKDHRSILSVIEDFTDESYPRIIRIAALQALEWLTVNANVDLSNEVRIDVPSHEVSYRGITEQFDRLKWKLIEEANNWLKHKPLKSHVEIQRLPYRSAYAPIILRKNPEIEAERQYIHQLVNEMNKPWKDACNENIFHFEAKTGLFSVFPEPVNMSRTKKSTAKDLAKNPSKR